MTKFVARTIAALLLLVGVVFVIWAIQTAWLTSFPAVDRSAYARRFEIEIGMAVLSLAASVYFVWRGLK